MNATARTPCALATVILSGGSARGFAHFGVIKVLEQAGNRPDPVACASAGLIDGALYASGCWHLAIRRIRPRYRRRIILV